MSGKTPTSNTSNNSTHTQQPPPLPQVDRLLFDRLFNEMVPLAIRLELNSISTSASSSTPTISNLNLQDLPTPSHEWIYQLLQIAETDEDQYNRILKRIRDMGISIGNKLTQSMIFNPVNGQVNLQDMELLMVMKFICRDVWKQMFGKAMDNLKTNHRGTFYLIDLNYLPISEFSMDLESMDDPQSNAVQKRELKLVEPFLELPVGIIKGVLESLGFPLDEVICLATFIDKPKDKANIGFVKGISFHVQMTNLK